MWLFVVVLLPCLVSAQAAESAWAALAFLSLPVQRCRRRGYEYGQYDWFGPSQISSYIVFLIASLLCPEAFEQSEGIFFQDCREVFTLKSGLGRDKDLPAPRAEC